jgi:hypothetical protein
MDDDGIDDGLGLEKFEIRGPSPRTYSGWHHPRKQIIRHAQWTEPLKDVLADRREPPTTLKYLGLPGRDLLDVRHLLEHACTPFERDLYFLGFDRTADAGEEENVLMNSAYADLIRSPGVIGTSVVMKDDIGLLANMQSEAFLAARDRAPFDVVNLDFCEPVLGKGALLFPLLKRLLKLQESQNEWLLLLTTFVDRTSFTDYSLEKLLPLLEQSRQNCEGFETVLAEHLDLPHELVARSARSLAASDFFTLSSVLFGKWLLRETLKARIRIKIVSACGYSVYSDESVDMLSLSIRVKPMHDTDGDDAGFVAPDEIDECEHAESMVRQIAKIDNIDQYWNSDLNIQKRYTRESIELIEAANHPIDPYKLFLESKGVSVPD